MSDSGNWFGMVFLHWFIVGFLLLFGLRYLIRPERFGTLRGVFDDVCIDGSLKERFEIALDRRDRAEGLGTAPGRALGIVALTLSIPAALTNVAPAIWYAMSLLGASLAIATFYLRMRLTTRRRAASLSPRSAGRVVPAIWFLLGALDVVAMLPYCLHPTTRLAAIIVAFSASLLLVVAWATAMMPSLLLGEDVEMEAFIDDRARANRARTFLVWIMCMAFVLASWSSFAADEPRFLAWLYTVVVFVAFCVWRPGKEVPLPGTVTCSAGEAQPA